MVKLSAKQPEIFASIRVRDMKAPNLRLFSLENENAPLLAAVKNLVKEDLRIAVEQLEKHLSMHVKA